MTVYVEDRHQVASFQDFEFLSSVLFCLSIVATATLF